MIGGTIMSCIIPNIYSQPTDTNLWNILLSSGIPRHYQKGEFVFEKDQPSNGLICLKKGKVKVSSFFSEGSEKIFGILVAPALFGETETLDQGPRMVSATALTHVEIVAISGNKTKELIYTYPDIALSIIQSIGVKLRWTTLQAEDLSTQKIEYRLARLLLDFKHYGIFTSKNNDNCLMITHEELAHFIGTARSKVTTYLNEFAHKGLIRLRRGEIRILDTAGLNKYTHKSQA
ncbi:cyclic nucleotide-binding domain protein [Desulfitobacterium hafniense DP7]|nr:cyclic nucleotide-binding domain protein [Desulfitobacterium hafniense DP7]